MKHHVRIFLWEYKSDFTIPKYILNGIQFITFKTFIVKLQGCWALSLTVDLRVLQYSFPSDLKCCRPFLLATDDHSCFLHLQQDQTEKLEKQNRWHIRYDNGIDANINTLSFIRITLKLFKHNIKANVALIRWQINEMKHYYYQQQLRKTQHFICQVLPICYHNERLQILLLNIYIITHNNSKWL